MVLTPTNITTSGQPASNSESVSGSGSGIGTSSPSGGSFSISQPPLPQYRQRHNSNQQSSRSNQNLYLTNTGSSGVSTGSGSSGSFGNLSHSMKKKSSLGNLFNNIMTSVRGNAGFSTDQVIQPLEVDTNEQANAYSRSPTTPTTPTTVHNNDSNSNLLNTNTQNSNNNNMNLNINESLNSFPSPQNAYFRPTNQGNRQRSTSTLATNPGTSTSNNANDHNRFNPVAYTLNMANSPTVANLNEIYENQGNTSRSGDNNNNNNNNNVELEIDPLSKKSGSDGTNTSSDIPGDEEMEGQSSSSSEGNNHVEIPTSSGQPSESTNTDKKPSLMDSNGNYSIRLTSYIDHSSSAPFIYFSPLIRKIKPNTSVDVGRYTEKFKKIYTAPQGSSLPVVFKSKVVSRVHAELSVDDEGKWYIKDKKSSSGTFLNHVRLSQPNIESELFVIKDGDILQLGMDYRGGSEELYRCIKVKVELNESWMRKATKFTETVNQRIKELTLSDINTNSSSDIANDTNNNNNNNSNPAMKENKEFLSCSICLCHIKPTQSIFISPCCHSWHYKCIRPIVVKSYPQFLCPNCKAVSDMEAEVSDDDDYD